MGEVLDMLVQRRRDTKAALRLMYWHNNSSSRGQQGMTK
jgi:transposase-like protein